MFQGRLRTWEAILCLLLIIPLGVVAQWVEFDACGLKLPQSDRDPVNLAPTMPAPNLGPYWVWAPSVHIVSGFTEKATMEMLPCTMLYVAGQPYLVIGSVGDVMQKIRKAKCTKR